MANFDDIRPFNPEELPEVYDRLLANPQFQQVLSYLFPSVPVAAVGQKMHQCKTSLDFQLAFCYDFITKLMAKAAHGFEMDLGDLDVTRRYTFMSNHRDIVLDSALLDVLLVDNGFKTTCEIAIGDNLLSLPWVKDLVRVNKSFIVKRGLPMREMIVASKELSEYMHHVIAVKHDNIWIAQRSGRTKDSDDRTGEGVLKMMTMGGEGSVIDRLRSLHIVPLTISYEYDPCDYLKAKEFQMKRDNPEFKKSKQDDLSNMKIGIFGKKGHIHYETAPCINEWLDELADMPRTELYREIAQRINMEIHRRYMLYPGNYVAADLLRGTREFALFYTPAQKRTFERYLKSRLEMIDLENKDIPYLRERILTMYANPVFNKQKANKCGED